MNHQEIHKTDDGIVIRSRIPPDCTVSLCWDAKNLTRVEHVHIHPPGLELRAVQAGIQVVYDTYYWACYSVLSPGVRLTIIVRNGESREIDAQVFVKFQEHTVEAEEAERACS